jgi:hypothetical protein
MGVSTCVGCNVRDGERAGYKIELVTEVNQMKAVPAEVELARSK